MVTLVNDNRYLNRKREYNEVFCDDYLNNSPKVTIISNGYVLPKSDKFLCKGGVTDYNKEFVFESSIINDGSFISIDGAYNFQELNADYVEESVIYLGYFYKHWGHFLMDCTTRMWILCDYKYDNYKVVFPNHPGQVCDGNYKRFMELAGISDDRLVVIDRPTKFSKILIPDEARIQPENRHMKCYYDIFDKVISNAVYNPNKISSKVYFSRGKMGKPELGESEIEHNYMINGYEVVFPESISLDEQIGIFNCANEIVSQNSSICMNTVFARQGLKWTVINKYSAIHDAFTELRYCKNLDLTYIDAFSEKLNFFGNKIGTLPYLVSFNDNMKKYFEDNNMKWVSFGIVYRVKNILCYLGNSAIILPKRRVNLYKAKFVRWMKRYIPKLFEILKSMQG